MVNIDPRVKRLGDKLNRELNKGRKNSYVHIGEFGAKTQYVTPSFLVEYFSDEPDLTNVSICYGREKADKVAGVLERKGIQYRRWAWEDCMFDFYIDAFDIPKNRVEDFGRFIDHLTRKRKEPQEELGRAVISWAP